MSRPSSFDLLLGQLNIELYGVGKGNGSNGSNGSQPVRYCECAELLDANGKRQPMPPGHSCEYVRQRNELIPEASRIATGQCGNADPYRWTKAFVAAMDELAQPPLNNGAAVILENRLESSELNAE